jgi:hypothetical protein
LTLDERYQSATDYLKERKRKCLEEIDYLDKSIMAIEGARILMNKK